MTTLERAIQTFGAETQTLKAIEEFGELIVALSHFLCGRYNYNEVHEEIADASIMISQLKLIFSAKMIERYEREKLLRLEDIIGEENERRMAL